MLMKNPPHPGGFVRRQCIEPLGLSITACGRRPRRYAHHTVCELVNEKRGISPETAVRLSEVFGSSTESWLAQPPQYDLAQLAPTASSLNGLSWPKAPLIRLMPILEGPSSMRRPHVFVSSA